MVGCDITLLNGAVPVYGMSFFFSILVNLPVCPRPSNREELFNLCHASARNVIERIFRILKQHFRILLLATKFPINVQAQIPTALSALHNFISTCHSNPNDSDPDEDSLDKDKDDLDQPLSIPVKGNIQVHQDSDRTAKEMHDDISQAMWDDYQRILADRTMDEEPTMEDDMDYLSGSDVTGM